MGEQLREYIKHVPLIPARSFAATTNVRAIDLLGLVAASVSLTIPTNPTDGDTLTVGGKAYIFQDTLTNVDGNIKIGASAAATQLNLVHAIMLNGGTVGTDYATLMTLNTRVVISDFVANVATVKAKSAGTDGNGIASTETFTATDNVFSAATLTGGRDDIAQAQSALVLMNVGNITGSPTSVKVKIQEANDVGFVTSPTTARGGDEVTLTQILGANTAFRFEVEPSKRYLRAVITFTGGTSPTAVIAANAILSSLAVPFPVSLEITK